MPTLTPNRKPALAALCALIALLTALAAASGSAARIPRQQLAACMRASHYQMPPTQTELANPKFTTALQRCLTKQHITTPTAKQLVAYDKCLIKHHVTLGTTPHQSKTYQSAKAACRSTLGSP